MDTFKDIFIYTLLVLLFIYGLYMIVGAMRNRKSFLNAYKRIDLIKLFGDLGRVFYVIFGLVICTVAILLTLKKLSAILLS